MQGFRVSGFHLPFTIVLVQQAAIRLARRDEIDLLLQLERQSATAAHWSRAQYEAIFQPDAPSRLCLMAESGALQGFLVAQTAGPEWELENLLVAPAARRQGVGTQLLRRLLQEARRRHARSVLLEVRASNATARALYQNCGFHETGVRPGYYQQPREDAVIYSCNLASSS